MGGRPAGRQAGAAGRASHGWRLALPARAQQQCGSAWQRRQSAQSSGAGRLITSSQQQAGSHSVQRIIVIEKQQKCNG
jgi:hypothetical protein